MGHRWDPLLCDIVELVIYNTVGCWGSRKGKCEEARSERLVCTSTPCEGRKASQAPTTNPVFVTSFTLLIADRDRKKGNVGWCSFRRRADGNCWVTFRGSGLFHFLFVCIWISLWQDCHWQQGPRLVWGIGQPGLAGGSKVWVSSLHRSCALSCVKCFYCKILIEDGTVYQFLKTLASCKSLM